MRVYSLSTGCLRWVGKGFTLWSCLASSIFLQLFLPSNLAPSASLLTKGGGEWDMKTYLAVLASPRNK